MYEEEPTRPQLYTKTYKELKNDEDMSNRLQEKTNTKWSIPNGQSRRHKYK